MSGQLQTKKERNYAYEFCHYGVHRYTYFSLSTIVVSTKLMASKLEAMNLHRSLQQVGKSILK